MDYTDQKIKDSPDSRTKKQWEIVDKWRKNGARGYAVAATGFGKSRIAENVLEAAQANNNRMKVIVGVPRIPLKDQWEKLLERFDYHDIEVYVYNTLCRLEITCDLLILDEVHRTPADTFIELFSKIQYSWLLGLTATFKRLDARDALIADKATQLCNISIAECRRNGWVSSFREYAVAVPLSEAEQREWDGLTEGYKNFAKHFGMDFGLAKSCLTNQRTRNEHARTRGWFPSMGTEDYRSPNMQFIFARNLMTKIQDQRRFLSRHVGKQNAAKEIILALKRKTLVFGESIATARELNDRLVNYKVKSAAYHSKMNKRAKETVLQDILDGKLDVVCSAKALTEGFDYPAAELGVSISRSKSKTAYVQQLGRVVRKHGDKESIFVHLYLPGTKDEIALDVATKSSVGIQWVSMQEFLDLATGQVVT